MATRKTPGGANADDLEASIGKLTKPPVEDDPLSQGRSRKGKGWGKPPGGPRFPLSNANSVILNPAEEERLKAFWLMAEGTSDFLIKEAPPAAEKAEHPRSLTQSGQQLQKDVELAKRLYYRAVSIYTEDNDAAGARALFESAQVLLDRAASSDQSDAATREKARRHAAMISQLFGDGPYRDTNEPLLRYLEAKDTPPAMLSEVAAEVERLVGRKLATAVARPLWDERAEYPSLANLSAPEFLKRVWADQIDADGTIEKELVRQKDRSLMGKVDNYIATRQRRRQDAGDAEGLRFIARRTRPKSKRRT